MAVVQRLSSRPDALAGAAGRTMPFSGDPHSRHDRPDDAQRSYLRIPVGYLPIPAPATPLA